MTRTAGPDNANSHAVVVMRDDPRRSEIASILDTHLLFDTVTQGDTADAAHAAVAAGTPPDFLLIDPAAFAGDTATGIAGLRRLAPSMRVALLLDRADRAAIIEALCCGVHGVIPLSMSVKAMTRAFRLVLGGVIFVPPALADLPAAPWRTGAASQPAMAGDPPALTPRQRDMLELIIEGCSNKEIAARLGLGEGTVKAHLATLFRRLNVRNRSAAALAGVDLIRRTEDRD